MGAAARDAAFNLAPIGPARTRSAEFRPGDVVLFEMNENYREADKPYFQRSRSRAAAMPPAARAAIQSGETDWAWNLQVEAQVLLEIEADGDDGVVLYSAGTSVEQILIQFADPRTEVDGARSEPTTQHPFFTELKVRQALALACDRETMAVEFYGPAGEATSNILKAPPVLRLTEHDLFTFEKAGALLDEAGWMMDGDVRKKDDVEMSILYQTSINPVRQKTQELNKQTFEQIGRARELKSIDAGVYFSSDAGNPDTASHFYADLEMFTNGPTVPYPTPLHAGWLSTNPDIDIAQQSNSGPA